MRRGHPVDGASSHRGHLGTAREAGDDRGSHCRDPPAAPPPLPSSHRPLDRLPGLALRWPPPGMLLSCPLSPLAHRPPSLTPLPGPSTIQARRHRDSWGPSLRVITETAPKHGHVARPVRPLPGPTVSASCSPRGVAQPQSPAAAWFWQVPAIAAREAGASASNPAGWS